MDTGISDSSLVLAARTGDRQAFGHLVERYQSLVAGVAYSATGNLAQSEDLAQETFIAAWKQLAALREPAKVRPWLCGITRHLVNNAFRRSKRDSVAQAEPLDQLPETTARECLPDQQAITREEERILWRSLETIPEIYREPLILYYREGQSIPQVSAALDVSEDTVKQRLSRGRKLLREELVVFVEAALTRSKPGKAFTLAVLAALPAAVTSASAATVGTVAAKAAVAKSAATAASGALLGPILGLMGGYFGARASINNTQSQRERRFMTKAAWIAAAGATLFTLALLALNLQSRAWIKAHPTFYVAAFVCVVLVYIAGLFGFTLWTNCRQSQIREQEQLKTGRSRQVIRQPFEYRSKLSLLGLPLVHVKLGNALGCGRGAARGWIAIGDTATGILFAAGGAAFGGIALGGLACGFFAIGGAAFGALAFGGWAMGYEAAGGGAIGWHAAFGGLAVAHQFAQGGLAIAAHANDPTALSFIRHHWFYAVTGVFSRPGVGLPIILAPILVLMIIQRFLQQKRRGA